MNNNITTEIGILQKREFKKCGKRIELQRHQKKFAFPSKIDISRGIYIKTIGTTKRVVKM